MIIYEHHQEEIIWDLPVVPDHHYHLEVVILLTLLRAMDMLGITKDQDILKEDRIVIIDMEVNIEIAVVDQNMMIELLQEEVDMMMKDIAVEDQHHMIIWIEIMDYILNHFIEVIHLPPEKEGLVGITTHREGTTIQDELLVDLIASIRELGAGTMLKGDERMSLSRNGRILCD